MLKHTKTTVSVCSYQDRLSRPRGNDFWRKTDSDFIFPTVQLKGDPAKRLKNTRITEIILEGHSWSISSISGIWTYYIYTCHTDRRFRNTRWTVLKNKEIFYFEYTWFCTCSTDAHREIILRMDPLDTYIYFFFLFLWGAKMCFYPVIFIKRSCSYWRNERQGIVATVPTIVSGRDTISSCFFTMQFVAEPRAQVNMLEEWAYLYSSLA